MGEHVSNFCTNDDLDIAAKTAKHRELKSIGYELFIGARLMPKDAEPPSADDDTPKAKLAQLKRMIEAQEQATADLKVQLEEVDKLL